MHVRTFRLDLKTWTEVFTGRVNLTGLTGFGTYTPFISVVTAVH